VKTPLLPHCLLALGLLSAGTPARAQESSPPDPVALKQRFLPGRRMAGAGLTGAGLHLKLGQFYLPGLWLGAILGAQAAGSYSRHLQAGLAGRYYLNRGGDFTYFLEGAYAYGYFRTFRHEPVVVGDGIRTIDEPYWSGNVQVGAGVDLWITRRISLEGAVRRHQVLETDAAFPGISLGANLYF
jgi:hypothetical protein